MDRWVLRVLWPLIHFSETRQAWVLRGIGRWMGPALVERRRALPTGRPARADRFTPGSRRLDSPGSRRFERRPESEPTAVAHE